MMSVPPAPAAGSGGKLRVTRGDGDAYGGKGRHGRTRAALGGWGEALVGGRKEEEDKGEKRI